MMKLIALSVLVSCFLVIKPCLSAEEKSNVFLCPDSSETSLVTAVVSGCKVYYTCKNAVVTKVFQCSESQMLTGTTHVCQENPQCPGVDSFADMINLPSSIEESKLSEYDTSVIAANDDYEKLPPFIDTLIRFIKCIIDVEDIESFFKTCIGDTLFERRPFLEIALSPRVMDIFLQVLNKSQSTFDENRDPTKDSIFTKVLKDVGSRCEMVCKDEPKDPEHGSEDKSQEKPHISLEDLKLSLDDGYEPDQVLEGDRVRRHTFSIWKDAVLNRPFGREPIRPPTPPTIDEYENSKRNDNKTLMSDVIVPIIKDLVNDQEAMKNTTKIVRIVFEALVPLATEILNASDGAFDLDRRAILKIPRKMVEDTVRKIYADAIPILKSTLRSKMPSLLKLLSRNTRLLFRSWDQMRSRLEPNMQDLITRGFELYRKYYNMFMSSSEDFFHTYSIIEIQQDIESMYSLLPDVSRELLLKNLAVFQDVSGVTTQNISKMLLDVPGIFDAMNAIPFEQYVYFLFLFL